MSSFFYMARSMQLHGGQTFGFDATTGDLHMMKNDEWGSVAYLSQSKYGKYGNSDYAGANKEIYQNKSSDYITGNSNGTTSQGSAISTQYEYNDMTNLGTGRGYAGPGASTTGNITGIYDMSGGTWEYVMGVLEYDAQGVDEHNGQLVVGYSGFKGLTSSGDTYNFGITDFPDSKYYNKYKSANPTSRTFKDVKIELACDDGPCYGHALLETHGESSYDDKQWYDDRANFIDRSYPFFMRGYDGGIFDAFYGWGSNSTDRSCRLTLTP